MTPRGQVKILDFGLAKELPASGDETAATMVMATDAGVVVGTVAYMSPEQALGRPLDARSDLFSFGIILYEMLTGKLPFGGGTSTEQIDAILHREPQPIPRYNESAPDPLVRLVRRMLEKDPEHRTQSSREVWNCLREIREELTAERSHQAADSPAGTLSSDKTPTSIPPAPVPTGPAVVQPRQRRWATLAMISLPVIAIALVAGIWLSRSRTLWQDISTPAGRRLVVLPAKVLAPAQLASDYAYLTDAVPSTLFVDLADVEGLEMQTPPNSIQVAQMGGDVARVMKAYGADLYLESDITADKTQLSWNVRLAEWPSKKPVWRKSYPGQEATYLQMVHQAADEIHAALVPSRREGPRAAQSGTNSAVELEFLHGVYYAQQYQYKMYSEDFDRAYSSLTHVLTLNPRRADAAAEIAYLFLYGLNAGGRAADYLPEVRRWAQTGLDLNPECGKCWAALSGAARQDASSSMRMQLEYSLKAAYFGRDLAQAHRSVGVSLGSISSSLGLEASQAAWRVDPMSCNALNNIGVACFLLGRSAEGLSYLDKALSIEPDHVYALMNTIPNLADLHRIEEAGAALRRLETIAPERRPVEYMLLMRAIVQLERSETQAASTTLSDIRKVMANPETQPLVAHEMVRHLTPFLVRRRRFDDAFAFFALGFERGSVPAYEWLMLNPNLALLRSDPRFKDIAAKSRAHFDEAISILNDARARGELPKYLAKPLAELIARLPR